MAERRKSVDGLDDQSVWRLTAKVPIAGGPEKNFGQFVCPFQKSVS